MSLAVSINSRRENIYGNDAAAEAFIGGPWRICLMESDSPRGPTSQPVDPFRIDAFKCVESAELNFIHGK